LFIYDNIRIVVANKIASLPRLSSQSVCCLLQRRRVLSNFGRQVTSSCSTYLGFQRGLYIFHRVLSKQSSRARWYCRGGVVDRRGLLTRIRKLAAAVRTESLDSRPVRRGCRRNKMARGRAWGHSALCPYKIHIAPTLTSEFGSKRCNGGRNRVGGNRIAAGQGGCAGGGKPWRGGRANAPEARGR